MTTSSYTNKDVKRIKFQQFTFTQIQEILTNNLDQWSCVPHECIKITLLTGMTNKTYMAKVVGCTERVEPSTVIFREFGNTEGFVDKNLEQFIFSEIGRMNLGPKEYAAASRWRIEEFINDATHPTCDMQHEALYQFNAMGLAKGFHSLDIAVANKNSASIIDNLFSEDLKQKVLSKMACENLYNEKELSILQEIKDIVESESQQQLMRQFVEPEPEDEFQECISFCHNDLNHLNIFTTKQPNREIVFIDYDYSGYNYPSYDIANFLNESTIDYMHPEEPNYCYYKDNDATPIPLHFMVLCYLLHEIFNQYNIPKSTLKELVSSYPNANHNEEELNLFQLEAERIIRLQFGEDVVEQLRKKTKFLKKRVRRFQIISNLNWIMWSVIQAKKPDSDWDFLDYGKLRVDMFKSKMNNEMRKINKKNQKEDNDQESCQSSDQTAASSSDSDEQA